MANVSCCSSCFSPSNENDSGMDVDVIDRLRRIVQDVSPNHVDDSISDIQNGLNDITMPHQSMSRRAVNSSDRATSSTIFGSFLLKIVLMNHFNK
ncbi:hypothetical protein KI387_008445, partial [Taxus chinensis]